MGLWSVMLPLLLVICLVPLVRGGNITLIKAGEGRLKAHLSLTIPPSTGKYICFTNKVSCVQYKYEASHDILCFVALEKEIVKQGASGVDSMDFVINSNHTGIKPDGQIKLSVENDRYCGVCVNGGFKAPHFSPQDIPSKQASVVFALKGCPTSYQKLAAILVPVCIILLVGCCLTVVWVRKRRNRVQKTSKTVQEPVAIVQTGSPQVQMTSAQCVPGTPTSPCQMGNSYGDPMRSPASPHLGLVVADGTPAGPYQPPGNHRALQNNAPATYHYVQGQQPGTVVTIQDSDTAI